ncbi:hypothetical protein LAZ67_20001645 [Cordylochernes scorpioides]|uniref:Reverse transcriptase Ty1/copia-type domain-containing protein n=1 Tax=Cordylochernes scorpioides TaxID=51811 RepID=A0ABY6LK65_9ARAC|nr:hypothetical protein LAZ67_20001645 [Cordylochernes scorpioides]
MDKPWIKMNRGISQESNTSRSRSRTAPQLQYLLTSEPSLDLQAAQVARLEAEWTRWGRAWRASGRETVSCPENQLRSRSSQEMEWGTSTVSLRPLCRNSTRFTKQNEAELALLKLVQAECFPSHSIPVPNVRRNLLSVSKIEENGNRVTFRNMVARVFNPENRIIAEATNVNGLYIVKGKTLNSCKTEFNSERDHFQNNSLRTWHQRLCHIDSNAIEKMAREELVIGLEISSRDKGLCDDYCIAKSTKASHKNLGNIRSKRTLELIHTDICGPMPRMNYRVIWIQWGSEDALPQPSTSKNIVRNPYGSKGKPRVELNLLDVTEPQSFEEAVRSPEAVYWRKAMDDELRVLQERGTWELSTLSPGKKPISSRWVYKVKTNESGNVERFKARLVARDNAYLYGDLEEEIYMLLPEGVERKDNEVYKLLRPIYGLRQSGRNWYLTLDHALQEMGFTRLESCNCIYTYLDKAIIAVYVDDLALFGESEEILRNIEQKNNERFRVKNLGAIRKFLGVQIEYPDEETLLLSQSTYVKSILQRFSMIECRPVFTPLDISFPISKRDCPTDEEEKERMKAIPYRELIGSLLYLANCTRPDSMFSVTRLAQFASNPGRRHWQAAKHVLRYLHGSINLSLVYRQTDSNDVCAYSDADWASDIDDRRSNSGTAITIGHSLVIWKTSKQKCVSLSTMEAEYLALSQTTKEAFWTANILKELKSKHIDIRYHHVRERIISGEIKIVYIPTKENLADVFTMTLSKVAHKNACDFMNCSPVQRFNDRSLSLHCGRPGHIVRYFRERRQVFADARARREPRRSITLGDYMPSMDEIEPRIPPDHQPRSVSPYQDHLLGGPIIRVANSKCVRALGRCVLKINVNEIIQPFEFIVLTERSHNVILGCNFLKLTRLKINFGGNELYLKEAPMKEELGPLDTFRTLKDSIIPPNSINQITVGCYNITGVKEVAITCSKALTSDK